MLVITNWRDRKEQPSLDKNIYALTTTSQKKCTRGVCETNVSVVHSCATFFNPQIKAFEYNVSFLNTK